MKDADCGPKFCEDIPLLQLIKSGLPTDRGFVAGDRAIVVRLAKGSLAAKQIPVGSGDPFI